MFHQEMFPNIKPLQEMHFSSVAFQTRPEMDEILQEVALNLGWWITYSFKNKTLLLYDVIQLNQCIYTYLYIQ